MVTGKKDATKSGKLLSSPKTIKTVKSVAGSDLAQTKWDLRYPKFGHPKDRDISQEIIRNNWS